MQPYCGQLNWIICMYIYLLESGECFLTIGEQKLNCNRGTFSGVIVTAMTFDRERQREYAVTVTATDQAADPLIGICQLNILILDENDNSPKFENLRYECEQWPPSF